MKEDTVLGGWPIKNEEGKVIGYHGEDGEESYSDYEQVETDSNLYRRYNHVSEVKNYWGTTYPVSHFLYYTWTCPRCGSCTESYSDCPGYGNPVMVCGNMYFERTITEKGVVAMACGNSTLYVCINPECEWEWRTDNRRRNCGEDPSWAQEATDYEHWKFADD